MILSSRYDNAWFAVHVRTGREQDVAQILERKGYEKFVPSYCKDGRGASQEAGRQSPLFPGYVFLRFDSHVRSLVVTTPFVIRILGTGKDPSPIDDREIDGLRSVHQSGCHREPCVYFVPRAKVRLRQGPLAGLEGPIVLVKNQYRMVVSVTLLQRSVQVEVDREWIEPESVSEAPPSRDLMARSIQTSETECCRHGTCRD